MSRSSVRKILLLLVALLLVSVTPVSAANKKFTIVIDAGHGGRDAGAMGRYSKEKDLTLKVAMALGKMIETKCPDVKVVYTRKTDVFVELKQRADIANRNKADLFISIHINSLPGGKQARGYQTWTLGRGETTGKKGIMENLDVAKRENSVIFLEKDYKQTYQGFDPNSAESSIMFELIQDTNMERSVELAKLLQKNVCAAAGRQNQGAHQNNLAVLRLTSMPGCLCELGFISTPDEENFMNSANAPQLYATGIYQAFMQYRAKYQEGFAIPYEPTVEQRPAVAPTTPESSNVTPPAPAEPVKQDEDPIVIIDDPTDVKQPNEVAPSAPSVCFKVQILASDTELKANSPQLKGQTGVGSYREGGMVKYTVGESADYNEIVKLKKSLADKFPQAFVIAFKDGEKIAVAEAINQLKAAKK